MSRVIIFDVDHGFCAFVKSPTGETSMIDCGRKESFSPVVYLINNELNGSGLTQLVVSHPHDDHIEDIEYLTAKLPPRILWRQHYDWEAVKDGDGDYENLEHYSIWQAKYAFPASPVAWGMDLQFFRLTPTEAKALNAANWVNNSGVVVVITIRGTLFTQKFVFGADVETDGFSALLKDKTFKAAVASADYYIVSHHGHTSGFSTELFNAMGKPILNLISVTSGDEKVDKRYSSPDCALGLKFDDELRYSLTTRTDGSIFVDVDADGKAHIQACHLDDNDEEDVLVSTVKAFMARR